MAPSASADRVTFRVQLGFRDYLDRTVASWRTWGLFLVVAALMAGTTLYQPANPPPDAVNSATKVFFMFEFPFLLVLVPIVILIVSLHAWRMHRKYLAPQEMTLSEESISFASSEASGALPWTSYTCYKETRWSFILWRGSVWTMFPKRTLASSDDLRRCRNLLAKHLRQSRWPDFPFPVSSWLDVQLLTKVLVATSQVFC